MSFQTCMTFFLLNNTKQDILKKAGNQFWFSLISIVLFVHKLEVNGIWNCFVTSIIQNILFCIPHKNTKEDIFFCVAFKA